MRPFVISIHSFIDVITNSSTELFVVDKSKIKEEMKELFELIIDTELDYETTVESYEDYRYKDDFILPEGCDSKDCYVIDASNSNILLEKIINKYFNPIEVEYKD